MEVVIQLQIETINICNAKCVFCPYTSMERAKGTMSLDLFKKITDEAKDIPIIDHFTLTGLGETLLDKHLFERLRYVRKQMPGILLDLYTNGTYLSEEKIQQMIDAGLSVLYISLNAANPEKRKEVMKLNDFEHVRKMSHRAIEMAEGKMKVYVKAVGSKDLMEHDDSTMFLEEWNGAYQEGGNAFIHLEGNWGGAMYPMRTTPTKPCARALNQFMVLWDGRVSLCCFDGEGDVVLGDLNKQTIREIYNGQPALGIREAHIEGRRGELKLCATCTDI